MDEVFEEFAREALGKAEAVDCSFDRFVSGLETMAELLKERLDAARDEQRSMQKPESEEC